VIYLYLLIFIPVSLVLEYVVEVSPVWVFATSILAIVPLAVWIRRGTEQIAYKVGPSIGGLLNVTLGNTAELIIMFFILLNGSAEVVKGQITGSIISNSLLALGLAVFIGALSKKKLTFNRQKAGQLSTMLILVLIGLLLPAIFDFTERDIARAANASALDEYLSLAVSVILILLYFANLVYTLVTQRDVFSTQEENGETLPELEGDVWPVWKAVAVLVAATAVTTLEAEFISGALEQTAGQLGISVFFLGVTVLAVIGNFAEYVSAVYFARRGDMGLVMSVTVGGTIQIALFVAPLLVLVSYFIGSPMNLVFSNPIELIAIASVAFIVNAIAEDGEATWFEGALLIGVYVMLAIAFFFVTPPG
jgi:Ca2+:H+ antiporter